MPFREYRKKQKLFRTLFKKTKKANNIQQISKACKDQSGREFYKLVKQLEPKLNKKSRALLVNTIEAEEEAEKIAEKFELIFGQADC